MQLSYWELCVARKYKKYAFTMKILGFLLYLEKKKQISKVTEEIHFFRKVKFKIRMLGEKL